MKYAYINGIILDGSENMEPQTGLMILTNNEKIEKILPANTVPYGYETVDLQGKYIMPGLINLHVHLPASGKPKKKETDTVKLVKVMTSNPITRKIVQSMCEGYAKTELYSGVTTIRTVGGIQSYDTKIRDRINEGKIDGPRILAANMAVSVKDGHMAGSLAYIAESAEDARKYVRIIAKDKPDLIKLMITGGVLDAKVKGEPGELKMAPEFVKAACEEAHSLGLKVAAHVESPEGVKVALENGVDSIEHGAMPDDEIIKLFKETGSVHIATIIPTLSFAKMNPAVTGATELAQYNGTVVFEGITGCAKACLENDIPVGLGTDTGCPFVTHYGMWREMECFHKYCGVTNKFALYTATKLNAQLVGLGDVTGSIEEGKCADLIVTERNPLENLSALDNIEMVVARGKAIRNPRVKKMDIVEKELDSCLEDR